MDSCCWIELVTYLYLGLIPQTEALEDSEDEDQDFVEVPEKEGYEPRIPDHLRAEYGELWDHKGRIGHQRYRRDRFPLWTMPLGCDIDPRNLAANFPCTAAVSVIVACI